MREAMNCKNSSLTLKLVPVVLLVLVLVQWENVCVSGSDSVQCKEDERSALLQINTALSFPIDSLGGMWEGKECCRWDRVTCDPITGHVTKLDLGLPLDVEWPQGPGFLLNTTLFLPLSQLRFLSLSGHGIFNSMKGAEFESWSNLTKLETLDLSSNVLPKSVISSLARVSTIRELYLDFNSIGGNIDVPVKELSALNLKAVSLYGCNFSGSFPDLGHWSSLQALSLGDNDLSGTIISEGLCRLNNLEELDLSSNNFAGNLPLCMGNLSSLKLLDMSYNQFQVKFPSFIFERLMSLRYLSLSNNKLEGTLSIRSFVNHSKLEVLRLSTRALNFRVKVANLHFQLQDLELANCILDVEPTFLYSQHKLRVLDLSNTRSKGPISCVWLLLENNPNMIALVLHKNLFTGPLQLPLFTHEKLLILDISYNHLGRKLPANITTKLPNLSYLNL
ncbi:receptor-like protein 9a [Carex rostrata]